jgi:hypothetical protein
MKTTEFITIMTKGYTFDVTYKINGRYIPAARYQPEEYPEIELISVKPADDNLLDVLHDGVTDEDIKIALEEALCERGAA